MAKKKDAPPVDEWAEERVAAEAQVAKAAAKRPGADNPDVIVEEGRALVKLHRLTDDGRHRAAVEFPLDKGGTKLLANRSPKEVGWARVPVLEYLEWLKAKPLKWLRDEATERTGRAPLGDLDEAVAAYLAALYQLEELKRDDASGVEGDDQEDREYRCHRIEKLERGLERHRALADVRGLTRSEFLVCSVGGGMPRQRTHTEGSDMEDAKEGTEATEGAKPSIVKKKVAPAGDAKPAAESKKPAIAKKKEPAEKKAKGKKPAAEKKPRAARVADPSKLDAYGKAKVAAQKELPVGKSVTYDGKPAKVTRHEARGGVYVEVGGKERLVSPFNFLKKDKPAKAAKPKADKKSKKK